MTKLKTIEEITKEMGYNGCRNCEHQIEPLRMCEWAERGGDGVVHMYCPRWDKRTNDNSTKTAHSHACEKLSH